MLFRVFILVSVGLVASASVVRSSQKPQQEVVEGGTQQLVRSGRHGPLQIVPQAWYENAIVAVSF